LYDMAEVTSGKSILSRLGSLFVRDVPDTTAIQNRDRTTLLKNFTSDSWPFWNTKSASGQTVTQGTAIAIPAVYRAVQIISDALASLKMEVVRVDSNGDLEVQPDHPVNILLTDPSPYYSKFTLKSTIQTYSLLQGNGYAFISRNTRTARPENLRIVAPEKVEPYLKGGTLFYKVFGEDGTVEVVEFTEMLHIPNLVLGGDHITGISTISNFKNSLGLNLSMVEWMGKTMQDGSPIQGLLSTETNLSKEQIEIAAKQWKDQLAKGSTPILPGGLKYQGVTLSPEDMLFVDNYKMTVEDISRMFGVPLHMLSSLDRATFSNIEEQSREFVTHTLRPWIKRWEAELNRKLLFETEKGTYRIRFNMESLLRGSTKDQGEFLSKMVLNGIMSRNEARKNIGLNSKDGLDEMPMPVQFQQTEDNE
jgi:HK97 family phage portal protein